ncbi:pyridoxamine 5'-phosphate oxidase family protein [Candidatus Microgenomates bacterium]|nr:pyridoxamine 5'-phosphate oxidase family protein [Candidatus Microgenomates bacterium]
MRENKLAKLARKIIKENIYLTLATGNKSPWAAPLYYCVDKDYNFYFVSQLNSRHVRNLSQNPHVSFAIFDSHQKEGAGNGVQGEGKNVCLNNRYYIKQGLKWYKTSFLKLSTDFLLGKNPYRLFKIKPRRFFILDPVAKVDKRVRVNVRQ